MGSGYQMFAKLHPAGGLYRYKAPPAGSSTVMFAAWKSGKYYLLVRWAGPAGISTKSPLLNAFFLVGGQERCVDISFFRYLEQVE